MAFFVSFLVLIAITIAIEELVIEKIYFPDTRGKRFRGVFYGLLDVLPIIFILSSFKYAWDTIQKMGQLEDMKVSLVENELKFLKSQVNPHFLFNNLNNLYAYALENSPKTPQIILELSAVLRYMLYDCQEKYVPLNNEIKHLQDFTKLNELQIEERGEIELDVKSNIDPDYQLAPLILIVFIENAFKHSTSSQDKEINISIAVELNEEGILHFTCSNSYVELSNHEMLKGGIGLDNVRKRLAYLYPDTHDLEIKEREGVFSVDLKLKLEKKV